MFNLHITEVPRPTDFDLGLETDVGAAPRGEVFHVHDVPRRLDGVRLVSAIRVKQVGVLGAAVTNLDSLRAASDQECNVKVEIKLNKFE